MVDAVRGDPIPETATGAELIAGVLWRYRSTVAASVALMVLLALTYLATSVPQYEATAVICPPTEIGRPQQPLGAGGLGVLDPSKSPPTAFEKFLAVMRTPEFAAEMDRQLNLGRRLFGAHWDEAHQRWKLPGGVHAVVLRLFGWEPAPFDPVRALVAFFDGTLIIAQPDKRVSLTTVSLALPQRELAQQVLATGLETARQLLIAKEERLLGGEIKYLETQLQAVQLVEHKAELSRLLAEQEREMMLLKAGSYGAEVLQAAYTPPNPSLPSVRLTLLLAVVAGLLIGGSIAMLRAFARS